MLCREEAEEVKLEFSKPNCLQLRLKIVITIKSCIREISDSQMWMLRGSKISLNGAAVEEKDAKCLLTLENIPCNPYFRH